MEIVFIFIMGIFIVLALGWVIISSLMEDSELVVSWKKLPTVDQYLQQYPQCRTGRGMRCRECGSGSIQNWGLRGSSTQSVSSDATTVGSGFIATMISALARLSGQMKFPGVICDH